MFELFPDQPVYEYSQMVNILYSFVWAFVLAAIIAMTHRLTFTGDHYPKNFFQSLILGAIVTTMVMMAIGDSLARGLGVFGAMAIIRFRTRIDFARR
jgi:ABC-type Fe3+ transport system permease subunit